MRLGIEPPVGRGGVKCAPTTVAIDLPHVLGVAEKQGGKHGHTFEPRIGRGGRGHGRMGSQDGEFGCLEGGPGATMGDDLLCGERDRSGPVEDIFRGIIPSDDERAGFGG